MNISFKIQFAQPEDIRDIIGLCSLHAGYEKEKYNSRGKAKKLLADLFSKQPKLYCLVAKSDGVIIAYTTYMLQYSTWDAKEYIYMDCLYVKEFARGLGIGEKLIKRIKEEGPKLNAFTMQWQTPDFNTRAMKFYQRIGATSKSIERFYLK